MLASNPPAAFASVGRRFLALLIDWMILLIPIAIVSQVLPVAGGLVVWFFYAPLLESSEIRATVGKHFMGIQVTDLQGNRLTLRTSLIRNLLKLLSTALCFAGHLFAFFTLKKQTAYDLLAETVVVPGKSEQAIADAWSNSIKELFGTLPVSSSKSTLAELERLQALREKGAITEAEFEAEKKKILG